MEGTGSIGEETGALEVAVKYERHHCCGDVSGTPGTSVWPQSPCTRVASGVHGAVSQASWLMLMTGLWKREAGGPATAFPQPGHLPPGAGGGLVPSLLTALLSPPCLRWRAGCPLPLLPALSGLLPPPAHPSAPGGSEC